MEYIRKDKFTKPYSPADVLKLALEKEKSSYGFYQEMLKTAKYPGLTRVLTELRDSEEAHIKIIKKKLEKPT